MSRRTSDTVKTVGVVVGATVTIISVLGIGYRMVDDFEEVQIAVEGFGVDLKEVFAEIGGLKTRVSVVEAVTKIRHESTEKESPP